MKLFLPAALYLALQCAVHADLQWEHSQLEFFPAMTDTDVVADFKFTNMGKEPVTIDEATSSCGCTTVTLDKHTWQPGEKGTISAVFDIGRRQGVQTKSVSLSIHGASVPVILTMVVHIPDLVKIDPQFISWAIGEAPVPKTVEFTILPSAKLHLGKVTSSDAQIRASVETVTEGSRYRIIVTPTETKDAAMALLNIQTETEAKGPMIFQAYARIAPVKKPQP